MPGASSVPATVANSISESDFQQQVLDLADAYGWRHYHTRDSRGSDPGFPDLVLIRPPDLLVVELKAEKGTITDAQMEWLRAFSQCGTDVRLWRPSSWPEIENTLKRRDAVPRAP